MSYSLNKYDIVRYWMREFLGEDRVNVSFEAY